MAKSDKSKLQQAKCVLSSMTGFGNARMSFELLELSCEVRSVNSRFFEFIAKLPTALISLEGTLRERARQLFERGRVEFSLNVRPAPSSVGIDQQRFDEVLKQFAWAAKRATQTKLALDKNAQIEAAKFALEKSRVASSVDDSLSQIAEKQILQIVDQAFDKLKKERWREGAALFSDLQSRISNLSKIYQSAKRELADLPNRTRQQIEKRIGELAQGIKLDENRLAQEIVHICDRADVTEELVRIEGHLLAAKNALSQPLVGRRLDFLIQELLREFNTLGNKSQNLTVQSLIVEAKLELEKVREQAQNLV